MRGGRYQILDEGQLPKIIPAEFVRANTVRPGIILVYMRCEK